MCLLFRQCMALELQKGLNGLREALPQAEGKRY